MMKNRISNIAGTLCFIAGLPLMVLAGGMEYAIKPVPAWVTAIPAEHNCTVPVKQISGGICYLLIDQQVNVNGLNTEIFARRVEKLLNNQGVESYSQLYTDFDPSYQMIALHSVRIIRNGMVIDQLKPRNISVMQREEDLEYRLYNGEKTISIILQDVRVNDIIEFAYTIKGINPVFKGHYFDYFYMGRKNPVQRLYWRLSIPQNAPLYFKDHRFEEKPKMEVAGQLRKYVYDRNHVPAIIADSDVPSWYFSYPWFQVGQFDKWSEVAQWGAELYKIPATVSQPLQKSINSIAQSSNDPVRRMAAALEAVQRDVRYLGIEIGPNSYAPTDPSLVFQRRFGDCKDKAYLLTVMLSKLGITAYPALVNTNAKNTIADLLPDPIEFDHVIVYASIDGKEYWLDPTLTYQEVPYEQRERPDYGAALLLNPATTSLTPMKPIVLTEPEEIVTEIFTLNKDKDKPVSMVVQTFFRGRQADSMRDYFKSTSTDKIEKEYVNFYADDYPSIKTAAPIEMHDNKKLNQVKTIEHYSISKFWTSSGNDVEENATLYARIIKSSINFPETKLRTSPLAIEHPVFVQQKIIARLSEGWDMKNEDIHIEDEAISFIAQQINSGKELILWYEYKTNADHVPVEQIKKHMDNLHAIKNTLNFQFSRIMKQTGEQKMNWLALAVAAVILTLATIGTMLIYRRYNPEPPVLSQDMLEKKNLVGIGGWLILVAIGLFLNPALVLFDILKELSTYSYTTWHALTTPGLSRYHPAWAPLLLGELSGNLCILVFSIFLLVLFYKRRQIFPIMFIIVRVGALIIIVMDLFPTALIKSTMPSEHMFKIVSQQALYTFIWSLYMIKSVRVKLTFRERRWGSSL